jgi:deoxyadenosine/deoxycytidine kinase
MRGREYENSIRIDYLKSLNDRYENWINGYTAGKLLIIDVDNIDFINNREDLGGILNKITAEIHGLF